jgi:hypothetical protein
MRRNSLPRPTYAHRQLLGFSSWQCTDAARGADARGELSRHEAKPATGRPSVRLVGIVREAKADIGGGGGLADVQARKCLAPSRTFSCSASSFLGHLAAC